MMKIFEITDLLTMHWVAKNVRQFNRRAVQCWNHFNECLRTKTNDINENIILLIRRMQWMKLFYQKVNGSRVESFLKRAWFYTFRPIWASIQCLGGVGMTVAKEMFIQNLHLVSLDIVTKSTVSSLMFIGDGFQWPVENSNSFETKIIHDFQLPVLTLFLILFFTLFSQKKNSNQYFNTLLQNITSVLLSLFSKITCLFRRRQILKKKHHFRKTKKYTLKHHSMKSLKLSNP